MRTLLFLFLFPFSLVAQNIDISLLKGVWVAKRVAFVNGSKIAEDTEIDRSNIAFVFEERRFRFYTNNTATAIGYTVVNNRIRTDQNTTYQIEKLTPFELQIVEISTTESNRLRFVCAKQDVPTFDAYLYKRYILPAAKVDSDTFFVMNEYVYPRFRLADTTFYDVYQKSYQLIEDAFRQTARPRRDRFRVSFIVSRIGRIENLKIIESTDPSLNPALKTAILASERQWIPARIGRKTVRTQVNYEFPFGLPEDKTLTIKEINKLKAKDWFQVGLRQFDAQRYSEALTAFNKAIEAEPGNVSFRFNRAATYFSMKRLNDACAEWQALANAKEKEAQKLLKKYCK